MMNTSRGFTSLGLILALVIGLVVFGGVGYYMVKRNAAPQQTGVENATTTRAERTTNALAQNPTPKQSNAGMQTSASATIDKSSLAATSSWPIIRGTYVNLKGLSLSIESVTSTSTSYGDTSGKNGRIKLYSSGKFEALIDTYGGLENGTYTVRICEWGIEQESWKCDHTLATGILHVAAENPPYIGQVIVKKDPNQLDADHIGIDITLATNSKLKAPVDMTGWTLQSQIAKVVYGIPARIDKEYTVKGLAPRTTARPVVLYPNESDLVWIQEAGNENNNDVHEREGGIDYRLYTGYIGAGTPWREHDTIDLFDAQGRLVSSLTF